MGLNSMPWEVVEHICSFLLEEDTKSLSQTCRSLAQILNENSVWRRFLSDDVKKLEFQRQIVKPLFNPDTDVCENYQHLMRKDRLLTNWRVGEFVTYSACSKRSKYVVRYTKACGHLIYQDNYIFIALNNREGHKCWDTIEIWDVTEEPQHYTDLPLNSSFDTFCIVGSRLVVVFCDNVDVYELRIDDKECSFLYSFSITNNLVLNTPTCNHTHDDRCVEYNLFEFHKCIVFTSKENVEAHFPVIYFWDIIKECQVGTFSSPAMGNSLRIRSSENQELYLTQSNLADGIYYCLKFNIDSKQFSETVFEYQCNDEQSHVKFYNNHIIVLKFKQSSELFPSVCRVYDFETLGLIAERAFDELLSEPTCKLNLTVDGKLFIVCTRSCLIVDALTLITLSSIQYENIDTVMCQISLFGLPLLVASHKCSNGIQPNIYKWDFQQQNETFFPIITNKPNHFKYMYVDKLYTKIVTLDRLFKEIFVTHFW